MHAEERSCVRETPQVGPIGLYLMLYKHRSAGLLFPLFPLCALKTVLEGPPTPWSLFWGYTGGAEVNRRGRNCCASGAAMLDTAHCLFCLVGVMLRYAHALNQMFIVTSALQTSGKEE